MKVVDDSVEISWRKYLSCYKKDFFEWKPVSTYAHIRNNKLVSLQLPLEKELGEQLKKLAKHQYKQKNKIIISGVYDNEDTDEVCTADYVFTVGDEGLSLKLTFKNKRNYVEYEDVKEDVGKVADGLEYMAEKMEYSRKCGADNSFESGFMMEKWV